MIEMNPYYAHESEVGPVFDVATFSPRSAIVMGLMTLVFAAVFAAPPLYMLSSAVAAPNSKLHSKTVDRENAQLWKEHPLGTALGVTGAGMVGLLLAAFGAASIYQAATNDFYLRAGEGGLSFCVPGGFQPIAFDLPWDEIVKLKVVQRRQAGSLSRNSSNLGGYARLSTRSHGDHSLALDSFREPPHLIYNRLQEARETRPAVLEPSC